MAIVYSYPLNDDIKLLDELVGTTKKSINGDIRTVTRNFLLSDLTDFFISTGGIQKTIILTTNNISGPATLNQTTGILNIPNYPGSAGGTDLSSTQTDINFTINSSTGTEAIITLGDGVLAGATLNNYSTAEKNKLGEIATSATANDTDANLKNRANHTGTQLASTISDFNTSVQSIADAKIAQTITSGVTATAPSQNAVFDALALKQNTLEFTPENVSNKENTTLDTSTTKYPTNNLVKTVTDLKANLASPTFTGVPLAPTAAANTNTTQIATTAFATGAVSGKMNTPSLTVNTIPKALTTSTIGNSRIVDTGTFLGIGTVNTPTKDITLRGLDNREIGVEESTSIVNGGNLKLSAGRTVNYQVSDFSFVLSLGVGVTDIATVGNDVYILSGSNIYKRTNETGSFVLIQSLPWGGNGNSLATAPNGDLYAAGGFYGGDIFKLPFGGSTFTAIGTGASQWIGITVAPNGDVYAHRGNQIYKQTGGVGAFNSLAQISRWWGFLKAHSNGNIYATVASGGLYMQTAGVGDFVQITTGLALNTDFTYLLADSNGDFYAVSGGGYKLLYKQTAGSGNFVLNYTAPAQIIGLAKTTSGNIYTNIATATGAIYVKLGNEQGTPDLNGGALQLTAGTGKGTGASDIEMYTGSKLASGTDMQSLTLRAKINNEGLMTLPSVTNALISAGGAKAIITKEYADATYSGGGGIPDAPNNANAYVRSGLAWVIGYTKTAIDNLISSAVSGKMNTPSLTVNTIPKALTASTIGNSRILDTGTYLGIGTVNAPTKDLTLGNQANREIGIEQSSNIAVGKDLSVYAGKTINFIPNAGFVPIAGQPVVTKISIMFSTTDGSVYYWKDGLEYKRTGGVGVFELDGKTVPNLDGGDVALAPNGDVYCVNTDGLVYKQTGGTGSFVSVGLSTATWRGITVAPNGDVYVTNSNPGKIYKQTGGTGSFVDLGVEIRSWYGIEAHPNGNIYAGDIVTGNLYMQTAGTGSFNLVTNNISNRHIAIARVSGHVYTYGVSGIYMQTGGSGAFSLISNTANSYFALAVTENGSVYAPQWVGGTIDIQDNNTLGTSNLNGGTLKLVSGTGKGTGDSNLDFYTGQKLPSGTDMQVGTLRGRINNEGLMTLPSVTNALIEADATGKAIVTKEYADATYSGGGGGSTNLSTTYAPTTVTVVSDTGTDAEIKAVDGTDAGIVTPAQKATWDGKQDALGFTPYNATNPSGFQTAIQVQTIADAKVANTITNGVTTSAPNQDVVFDALALKSPLSSPTFSGTVRIPGTGEMVILSIGTSGELTPLPLATYPGLLELSRLKGITDVVQTQLNGKQPISAVLTATTASFTTADETKLDGIATGANVGVVPNTAITGATKTKITYDTKGLVTAGADANLNDLSDVNINTPLTNQILVYDGLGEFRNGLLLSSSISDFNSATRAQTEAELVAGTNITITPSGTGATRQLTIASSGGGGGATQSAFTVLANNTASTATPTEQVFKCVGEQTYAGIITWGTTAPTTILANTYRWQQVGKFVTAQFNFSYNTPATNSQVTFTLPTDMPTPQNVSGFTGALDIICYGVGIMFSSTTAFPTTARVSFLRRNSANTGYEFLIVQTSGSSIKTAQLIITYEAL